MMAAASESDHRHAAQLHLRVADSLRSSGEGVSWVPTARFYAALHLFDARCASAGVAFYRHDERLCHMRSINNTATPLFKNLKQLSENWRYQGVPPTSQELDLSEVWLERFRHAISR